MPSMRDHRRQTRRPSEVFASPPEAGAADLGRRGRQQERRLLQRQCESPRRSRQHRLTAAPEKDAARGAVPAKLVPSGWGTVREPVNNQKRSRQPSSGKVSAWRQQRSRPVNFRRRRLFALSRRPGCRWCRYGLLTVGPGGSPALRQGGVPAKTSDGAKRPSRRRSRARPRWSRDLERSSATGTRRAGLVGAPGGSPPPQRRRLEQPSRPLPTGERGAGGGRQRRPAGARERLDRR